MDIQDIKFPRIFHLSSSPGVASDDKVVDKNLLLKLSKQLVVVTEKLDGENTAVFHQNGVLHTHARSTNPRPHPSRNYLKQSLNARLHKLLQLPDTYKLFGEYLYAKHSIEYDDLEDYFYLFAVLDTNVMEFLSWDEVVDVAKLINVPIPQIIYTGKFKEDIILEAFEHFKGNLNREVEGFVVRSLWGFSYEKVFLGAKWVRANHVQTNTHWMESWEQNKLKGKVL